LARVEADLADTLDTAAMRTVDNHPGQPMNMLPSTDQPLLLTVAEVCRLLHRSKARVYEMVRTHEL